MDGPADQIEMGISKVSEVIYIVTCGLAFPSLLWAAIFGFADLTPEGLSGIKFEGPVVLLLSVIGPLGFQLIAGAVALMTGAVGMGAVWRLRDPRPTLIANASGLVFHPSLYPRVLLWHEIERISLTQGRATQFRFVLLHWKLTLHTPVPTKRIDIALVACRLSYRQAERNMRLMRRWQREARH